MNNFLMIFLLFIIGTSCEGAVTYSHLFIVHLHCTSGPHFLSNNYGFESSLFCDFGLEIKSYQSISYSRMELFIFWSNDEALIYVYCS